MKPIRFILSLAIFALISGQSAHAQQVIKAGTTTTGAPGTKASVSSRVKGTSVLFDFVIPKGAPGLEGPAGPVGPVGPQGPSGAAADKTRSVFFPAKSLNYTGNGITAGPWGLTLTSTTTVAPGLIVPKPVDWDETTSFSITIYFSLPSAPTTNTVVNWRLQAGGCIVNSTAAEAGTGWDSLNYYETEDAPSLLIPVATGPNAYFDLAKTQTWTAKYSEIYNTWYFGSSVNVVNNFKGNPLWHFAFQRGSAAANGESFTGDLTINGISVNYTSK